MGRERSTRPKSSCCDGAATASALGGFAGRRRHGDARVDGVGGGLARQPAEQILDVDHAARIIERLAEQRNARNAGLAERAQQLGQRVALFERDDVGARHHDVVDARAAEAQQPAQHLALFVGECGGGVGLRLALEVGLEHLAQARRAQADAAEQRVEQALRAAELFASRSPAIGVLGRVFG